MNYFFFTIFLVALTKSFMAYRCAVKHAVYGMQATAFNIFYDKLTPFNYTPPPPSV
jgi:hypothetical protein